MEFKHPMQTTWKHKLSNIKTDFLWWGIVALGIFLRLRYYLLNRSLWADEASLALNIVTKNFRELTQLLDYHQAAPIGYLFIEKFLILVFGNLDYVLRLFPLFAGILATYLIYKIARASFGTVGLLAASLFSISWMLVHYSTELKQYSSDVMVALLLVYLGINCLKENVGGKEFLTLGIVGAIVIWVSHPSVFIMVGVGFALVLEKFTRRDYVPWIWVLGVGTIWLASFGLEYLVSLQHIVSDGYLIDYWNRAYVPNPPWTNKAWYISTFYTFLFYTYHRGDNVMALITLVFCGIGFFSLVIRNRKTALLIISPFVVVAIVSMLQRYPLKNRFMLFLVPFAFLLITEGIRTIYWLIAKWKPNIATIVSGLLALTIIWQIAPITYEKAISRTKEDIRPVLVYIAENKQPDDILYVFHRTEPTFRYYAPFYGLDSGNVIIGVADTRKQITLHYYYDDVVSLIGNQRVWFLFSEVVECVNCAEEDTQEFYLEIIDEFGTLIDSYDGSGANAYLYDLSQ